MIKILILLLILGVLLAIWALGIEPNMLKVTTYKMPMPELSGLKIVFASDFHIAPKHKKRLEKIVKKINQQKADLILSTVQRLTKTTPKENTRRRRLKS